MTEGEAVAYMLVAFGLGLAVGAWHTRQTTVRLCRRIARHAGGASALDRVFAEDAQKDITTPKGELRAIVPDRAESER